MVKVWRKFVLGGNRPSLSSDLKKQVSMTWKCHNHTPQHNPQQRKEEAKNNNSNITPRRQ